MPVSDTEIREVMWDVFPKREEGYREHQESSILKIVKAWLSGKKFVTLGASTGFGKSVAAYTAIKTIHHFDRGYREDPETEKSTRQYNGPYGLISVHTRALQIQYAKTFPDIPNIWSGSNYTCAVSPLDNEMYWGCGECPKKRCVKYDACDYANSVRHFMQSDFGITNYAYYLHAPFLSPFVSVIDECHNLETILCDWSTIELSTRFLTQILLRLVRLEMLTSSKADDLQGLIRSVIFINDKRNDWLDELHTLTCEIERLLLPIYLSVNKEMETVKSSFDDPKTLTEGQRAHLQFLERSYRYFRNLIQKLKPIHVLETEWVISSQTDEENKEGRLYPKVDIKPLYINEISNIKLFQNSEYFLFMSATPGAPSVFTKYLGIPTEKSAFFQVPSTFPVENRPVYVLTDIGKFTYKNKEEVRPLFTHIIDVLLKDHFPNVRGIIHSVSYENADYIQKNSTQLERLRFPKSEDLLEIFKILEEREDTVVVSPTVVEGHDLKDDLCRFAIFMKVPWQSLGDKWIKARSKDDLWYAQQAITKLIQGSGRGTRSEQDHSTTVVIDAKFVDLWRTYKQMFPKWYSDSVQFMTKDGGNIHIK